MSGISKQTELQKALAGGKSIFWIVGLFSFFINLLMLVGPFYMLQVYDRVLTSGSIPTLIFLTIAAVGLTMVSSLLEWLRSRILVRLNGRLEKSLRQSLFSGLFKSGGRDSQPLKDLETTRGFLSGNGLVTFFDAPWAPIFLALIFVFHPILGFIATLGAVLLFTIAILTEFLTRGILLKSSSDTGAANRFVEGALLNREVVMALGMLPGMYAKWRDKYDGGHAGQALAADRSGMLNAIAKFIRPVLQVAMLGTGAWLALNQEISPGVMIASSIVMGRALAPVQGAIGSWKGFVLARSAYDRLKEFYAGLEGVKLQANLPKPQGTITVERAVGAPPKSEVPVIKGVSFNIPAGSSVGIIGPSASGKSTLARLLTGVWAPTSGKVRLDGVEISKWDHEELGPSLGYLPQDVELFDGTVLENISRFSEGEPSLVIEAAKSAGIHEMILALPNGYETIIGPMGSVLSGGQRQRIGLARALYGDPSFIVLDEPNSNLDSDGEEALKATLIKVKERGATLVIISHRPAVINVVDHVMILKNGMIEDFGTRQEVLARMTAAQSPNIRSVNAGAGQ
ncbi:MAG: type I secretion system permease/ATPase [Sneathiella sp.]|nr:type I secretion system permease/ATPase [Sneathiella sp.]